MIKDFLNRSNRGFTLIELLVVMAIIGILSSIVLVMLNSTRDKGNDAKIKSQLSRIRAASEIYFDTNGNYGATVTGAELAGASIGTGCNSGMFISSGILPYTIASNYPAVDAGTGKCTTNGSSAFAVSARLTAAGTFWCMDSVGTSKQTGALHNNSTYVCP